MTVADNYDIEKQETNGTTKIFSFNFYTASKDFVKVIKETSGIQEVVPATDYTIKLNTLGGNVIFPRAPAAGSYIIIVRETPHEQETSFATSSGFPAKTVEGRFDKLTAMIQEMQDTDNRTPSFPVGTDLNVTLPLPEAGKALIWNEDEDNLENSQTTFDDIVNVAVVAKDQAVAAKDAAQLAQGIAEQARDDAQAAQTAAETAVDGFDDYVDSKKQELNVYVEQAEGYATAAGGSATNAHNSELAAAGSASDASGYKTDAQTAAGNASTSATNASVWAEGTDQAVEALGGEHSSKRWTEINAASLSTKQDKLVSGTNIKTINGSSLLGSGNLVIGGNVQSVNGKTGVVVLNASDVGALSNSTKYGASVVLSLNTSTFVLTAQLKDQSGNNLGNSTSIDLPLESVVVNGAYDDTNKKIILTLQSGATIDIPVADLVDGLQEELVSGVNIKTVNNNSLLGSGNLDLDIPTDTSELTNGAKFAKVTIRRL